MPTRRVLPHVLVLYNHVGRDEYEALRDVDLAALDFTPEYPIHVATVREEIEAVVKALKHEGYAARAVNVQEDFRILQEALRRRPDAVFNLVEFLYDTPGMESSVAALFELHQIPFTGAGPFALNLCNRKGLTKQVLLANGVPTPRFRLLNRPVLPRRHGLRYPLIVKPAREDASAGVSKDSVVRDYASLMEQVGRIFAEFSPPLLVEEYIEGRELHVSILGNDPPEVLPIIEFDFSQVPPDHPRIISFDAKWNPLAEEYHRIHSICPAKLKSTVQRRIAEMSVRAFKITGCRDYARLDLRLDAYNHPYVLEVNPNPDLTEGVSFMESAEKAGMTFSRTLRKIVELALSRTLKTQTREARPV
jgi:D-alanine-D-alanine ligase